MKDITVIDYACCPCGAPIGFSCLTKQGHSRPPHAARRKAAEKFIEKWTR